MRDADDAVLDPELREILERLRPRVGHIVVLSSRDQLQLGTRVPDGWLSVASHGLELPREIEPSGAPPGFDAIGARASLARAREELAPILFNWPGARLETKHFAMSIHFRQAEAPPADEVVRSALEPLAIRHGLRLVAGRQIFELRPDVEIDKGWTLRFLKKQLRPTALMFAGDDLNDAPGWAALRGMNDIPTLGVGIASAETPRQAFRDCDLVLTGRAELRDLCLRLSARAG